MAKRCSTSNLRRGKERADPHPSAISFFKIMIGPFETALHIPPKASTRLAMLVDHSAYLEDSNGKCWKVEVSYVQNSLAFHEGWPQFVQDHGIIRGELVVFRYNGGRKFSLYIYGISGLERLSFPTYNNVSNNLPPSKKKKRPISPQTTEIKHDLHSAGLTAGKTSQPYDNQFLIIKNNMAHYSPAEYKSTSPSMPVSKNSMSDIEFAQAPHQVIDKPKIIDVPKETLQTTADSGIDVLENQSVRGTDGVRFLVDKNGTCFLFEEYASVEPNQCLAAPISVDVSAMTNVTLLTNEVISPDHENSTVPRIFSKVEGNDKYDSANQDLSTDHLQDFGGNAPELMKIDEVPVIENGLCCINNVDVAVRSLEPIESTEKCLDMVRLGEMAIYIEDPQEAALKCPESQKPNGVEAFESEVLALPEVIRFRFSVDDKIQSYQELSSSLPIKGKMRIDRKVVILRDSSQRMWPVIYHDNHDAKFTGFSCGWYPFASANGIKGGNECILELAHGHEALFDVKIS